MADKILCNKEDLVNIADNVRAKLGPTDTYYVSELGEAINGISVPVSQTKTVELSMSSGNQTISPDSGKVLSKVTVNKLSTLIPANIKKDVVIGGVTGTLESGSGSASETWVWNSTITKPSTTIFKTISFASSGEEFMGISISAAGQILSYVTASSKATYPYGSSGWTNQSYRKITFSEPPTGDLLTYLQANAVKQASDTAVQTDRTITITSNGTTTITPTAPYDAMSKVGVTVNVAGSGYSLTFPATDNECWDKFSNFFILTSDGVLTDIYQDTYIGSKTYKNVVAFMAVVASSQLAVFTVLTGKLATLPYTGAYGVSPMEFIVGDGEKTPNEYTYQDQGYNPTGSGINLPCILLEDTILSGMEI